jgi:hypothetical protein
MVSCEDTNSSYRVQFAPIVERTLEVHKYTPSGGYTSYAVDMSGVLPAAHDFYVAISRGVVIGNDIYLLVVCLSNSLLSEYVLVKITGQTSSAVFSSGEVTIVSGYVSYDFTSMGLGSIRYDGTGTIYLHILENIYSINTGTDTYSLITDGAPAKCDIECYNGSTYIMSSTGLYLLNTSTGALTFVFDIDIESNPTADNIDKPGYATAARYSMNIYDIDNYIVLICEGVIYKITLSGQTGAVISRQFYFFNNNYICACDGVVSSLYSYEDEYTSSVSEVGVICKDMNNHYDYYTYRYGISTDKIAIYSATNFISEGHLLSDPIYQSIYPAIDEIPYEGGSVLRMRSMVVLDNLYAVLHMGDFSGEVPPYKLVYKIPVRCDSGNGTAYISPIQLGTEGVVEDITIRAWSQLVADVSDTITDAASYTYTPVITSITYSMGEQPPPPPPPVLAIPDIKIAPSTPYYDFYKGKYMNY